MTSSQILRPLAARYASWLELPAEQTAAPETTPELVRAMQMVLRLEKADPPSRTPLLAAAATAAVALCLDERAQPGGPWHAAVTAWVSGHIRKVARRARGAHWVAAQEIPGVTVARGGAEVRAIVPGKVGEVPKEIARLQISGSDLPADDPGPPPDAIPLLWLNPEVTMTVGKAAAQVGHGTMLLAALLAPDVLDSWAAQGFPCAVRTPTAHEWRAAHPGDAPAAAWRDGGIIAVRDAGFTEVDPGTVTVLVRRA